MRHNIYRWTSRISRRKIKQLYDSDAQGLLDENLVNEVGFTIYMRCLEAQEVMDAVHHYRVKCRNCKELLIRKNRIRKNKQNHSEILKCKCGWETTWGQYRQSTFNQNMCSGGADPFFMKYVKKWPKTRNNSEKMMLIDWMIHQFHIQDQIPGRSVAVNIISGTHQQVDDLINELAYGDESQAFKIHKEYYDKQLKDWRKLLIKKIGGNSRTRLLGEIYEIEKSNKIPLNELIDKLNAMSLFTTPIEILKEEIAKYEDTKKKYKQNRI